jgi:uroporphyrinogen decarboxylase
MGFDVSLNDIKTWTNNQVTLLGNIPPRDVLANGKPKDVVKSVTELLDSLEDKTRVILSCGGGLPPGVSTENLKAFIETVKNYTPK